ncbi:MAG TPA: S-layer homology domain-containing protein [Candidatus Evtepia faecigallinarum]|nr:S-layer homology domain-containing protein [Candidatus Evtepia faecigallinarum]
MICIALNGGKEPATSTKDDPTFTDIDGHWAEGYIEYCYAQGVVSGVGGGRFNPDGNVTVTQAAKMLLVALGYNADVELFNGENWSLYVNVKANQDGIYEGLEAIDTAAALTRDQAAQMIWNTMQAVIIVKTSSIDVTTGDVTAHYNKDPNGKTLLTDKYSAYVNVGTLDSVNGQDLTLAMTTSDENDSDKPAIDSFTNVTTDYSSLLGQKVKVMFTKANNVMGVYALDGNTTYTVDMKDIEADGNKVKFGGTSYAFDENEIDVVLIDANEETVADAGTMSAADFDAYDADPTTDAAGTAKLITASVRFVDNDGDGKLNIAIITEYKTAKVTYVGADRITAGTTYKMEDENIADDIAKNDYAVMSYNPFDECLDIVKADVVSDVLTGLKDQDTYQQYQIGGTWYNIDNVTANNVTRGDTVLAYVVNGIAIDIKSDDGTGAIPSNIAVVVGNGGDASVYGDQVRLRYFNGTNKIVTLSDQNTEDPTQGVAFRVSGSDTSTRLEPLADREYNGYQYEGTNKAVAAGDNGKVSTIDDVAVADDAVIILYTEAGQSKQITGKQFKALAVADLGDDAGDIATAVFTKSVNGLNRVRLAAVLVGSINITGASSDNYAYVTSASYINADGDTVINIWTGSENKTVTENGNGSVYAKGELIGYSTIDSNNVISDVQPFGTVDADTTTDLDDTNLTEADGMYRGGNEADDADDMIVINGKQLNVTSDTHVLVVDSAADDEEDIGIVWDKATLPQGKEGPANVFAINAFFSIDSADDADTADLKVLVIDTTGVFSAFDEAADDEDEGGAVEGDYTTKYAAVNVADKNVVTAAASSRAANSGNVTIALTVPSYINAIDNTKITAMVDGVPTAFNTVMTLNGTTISGVINDVAEDAEIVVTVADGLVTKVNASGDATAKEFTNFKGITFAAAPAITNASANASTNNANLIVNAASANGNDNYNMNGKTLNVTVTLTGATFDDNDATTAVIRVSGINNSAAADNNNATAIPAFTANGDSAVILTVTSVEEAN